VAYLERSANEEGERGKGRRPEKGKANFDRPPCPEREWRIGEEGGEEVF